MVTPPQEATTEDEQELGIISSHVSTPQRDEELKTIPSEVTVSEDQEPKTIPQEIAPSQDREPQITVADISETPEQILKVTPSEVSVIQVKISPQRSMISDQVPVSKPERPEVGEEVPDFVSEKEKEHSIEEVPKPDSEVIISSEKHVEQVKSEEPAEIKQASEHVLEALPGQMEQVESIAAPRETTAEVPEARQKPVEEVASIAAPRKRAAEVAEAFSKAEEEVESIAAPRERVSEVAEALSKSEEEVESIATPRERAAEVPEAFSRPVEQVESVPTPGERVTEQQATNYVRGEPVDSVLEPAMQVTTEPRLGDQKITEHHPSLEERSTTSTPSLKTSTPAEPKFTPDVAPLEEEARGDQPIERSEPSVEVLVEPRAGVSSSSKASSEDDVALGDHLSIPAPLPLDDLEASSTEETFQSMADTQASKERLKVPDISMGDHLEFAYLDVQARSSRESTTSSEMVVTARSSSATILDTEEIVTEPVDTIELPREEPKIEPVELSEEELPVPEEVSDVDQWSLGLPEAPTEHAQCDCIDCLFLSEVDQAADKKTSDVHPSDCTCVECITDPSGFTCGDVRTPPVADEHEMGCDCMDCLFKPCPIEEAEASGPHAPDCDCLDCLCDPCLEEPQLRKCPGCDCENCVCEPCELSEEYSEEDCTCEPCLKEASRRRGEVDWGKGKGDRLDPSVKMVGERLGKGGEERRGGYECPVCVCGFFEKSREKGIRGDLKSSSEPCDFSCAEGDNRQRTVLECKCVRGLYGKDVEFFLIL